MKGYFMSHDKKLTHKIGRDARTGEFITVKEAQRRPNTTVVETMKRGSPPSGKKK
jgi:hypothetical protein